MNRTFDISRFGALLKRYVVENRKQLFFLIGVMWGVMVLMAATIGRHQGAVPENVCGAYYREAYVYSYNDLHLFYVFAMMVFACLFGSYAFSSLKGKRQRVSTLMVPASMLEKFMVRMVIYVLGFYVVYVVGMTLSDLSRYLFAGGGMLLPWVEMLKSNLHMMDKEYLIGVTFMQSVYVLGSSIWPKLSFFKTFLVLFVLMLCSVFFDDILYYILRYTGLWLVVLITLGCYVLAWLRFRRVQVIQRFM